jgi:hypothetical protein
MKQEWGIVSTLSGCYPDNIRATRMPFSLSQDSFSRIFRVLIWRVGRKGGQGTGWMLKTHSWFSTSPDFLYLFHVFHDMSVFRMKRKIRTQHDTDENPKKN